MTAGQTEGQINTDNTDEETAKPTKKTNPREI